MLLILISQLFNWCWSNQTQLKPIQRTQNINFSSLLNFNSRNCSWLMSFYISEQKTYEVLPENITDLRMDLHHTEKIMHLDCKHIPCRILLSELVSRSARLYTTVSCWKRVKILKHLDNYCSPGFWATIMWWQRGVCSIWLVTLVWRFYLNKKWKKPCLCCIALWNIWSVQYFGFNTCDVLTKSNGNNPKCLIFLSRNMTASSQKIEDFCNKQEMAHECALYKYHGFPFF